MKKYYDLTDTLWRELCLIPAPTFHEERRSQYILDTIAAWGIDAQLDEVNNVVIRLEGKTPKTVVFAAHIDTVFPDTEPLPFTEDEKNVYCAGSGDDTAEVAMLMATLKYLMDSGKKPNYTVLVVFDTCEEGLGHHRGIKAVLEKYKNIEALYTFDGTYDEVVNVSVGAQRYKVTVETEGGHAFQNFGNKTAAYILSQGISRIYETDVPQDKGASSYNVGTISGGASVNSICQKAEMLCEFRSTSGETLSYLKNKFFEAFEYMRELGATVTVSFLGESPCAQGVDGEKIDMMAKFCKEVQERYSGIEALLCSGTTDCNVAHSMGIPAVCVGAYMGGGIHSREEWTEKASIPKGFDIVREIVSHYFD